MQGEEEKGPQAKRARVENDAKSSSETIADLDNTQREAEIEATMRAESIVNEKLIDENSRLNE
jgi:hypothetical protein